MALLGGSAGQGRAAGVAVSDGRLHTLPSFDGMRAWPVQPVQPRGLHNDLTEGWEKTSIVSSRLNGPFHWHSGAGLGAAA